MSEHGTLLYLSDIRDAIEKIDEFVKSMSLHTQLFHGSKWSERVTRSPMSISALIWK